MAKRPQIQLQAELESDEDFENFLMYPGLLVIDVYAEWCGPCVAMVSTLRRIKLDVGPGLTLAIAKCDTISCLHRFHKKSEPTWLLITDSHVVNLMFGTDPARLASLIYEELRLTGRNRSRRQYGLNELLPEEEYRLKIKNDLKAAERHSVIAEREREKYEHFKNLTDLIMENLPEMGVIIFAPHVGRDLVFKTAEFSRKFNLQCKDRQNQVITKKMFQEINYVCKNPLSEEIIDVIAGKEFIISLWRVPDHSSEEVPTILQNFVNIATTPQTWRESTPSLMEYVEGPCVGDDKIEVEYELPDGQECPIDPEVANAEVPSPEVHSPEVPKETKLKTVEKVKEVFEDTELISEEAMAEEMGSEEEDEEWPDENRFESFKFLDLSSLEPSIEPAIVVEEGFRKAICKKTVTVPGMWTPEDSRTNAALIYHLFRSHTNTFLPPDPIPEPPHVIMAFHTYKHRDLLDFASRYKDDIPAYGYFTSDDADEAKFIANSKQKYAHHPKSVSDKLVFKVNKQTSNTMLSLVGYGPTYVSINTEVGEKEALKFFPPEYETAEQEMRKIAEAEKQKMPKQRKNSRTSNTSKSSKQSFKLKEVKEQSSELEEDNHLFGEEEDYVNWMKEQEQTNEDIGGYGFAEEAEGEDEGEAAIIEEQISIPQPEEERPDEGRRNKRRAFFVSDED